MRTAIFFIGFLLLTASSLAAGPKLEIVGGNTYDWGKVKETESPLKTKITLKNAGDELLVIERVKPTCGCTTAPLDKKKLAPGESTTMHVKLNINRRSGHLSKSIRITTNDPERKVTVLMLKADVQVDLSIRPVRYFSFRNLKVGQVTESHLVIKNQSDKPMKFTNVRTKPEILSVNIEEGMVLKPKEEFKLIAKVKPKKTGYMNCELVFNTDNPDYEEVKINGFGSVKESPIFTNDK